VWIADDGIEEPLTFLVGFVGVRRVGEGRCDGYGRHGFIPLQIR
jgi:hypothetical protein